MYLWIYYLIFSVLLVLLGFFIVLNVANILINHCVSFSAFAIFCAVGFILFFILFSLSLFFEYGGYLLCLVLFFQ